MPDVVDVRNFQIVFSPKGEFSDIFGTISYCSHFSGKIQ